MSTDRSRLTSSVVSYALKVWIAGFAAAVLVPLSLAGLVIDLFTGRTEADSVARRVLAASARFEAALDVHDDLTEVTVRPAA